jgi:hypothetical protein
MKKPELRSLILVAALGLCLESAAGEEPKSASLYKQPEARSGGAKVLPVLVKFSVNSTNGSFQITITNRSDNAVRFIPPVDSGYKGPKKLSIQKLPRWLFIKAEDRGGKLLTDARSVGKTDGFWTGLVFSSQLEFVDSIKEFSLKPKTSVEFRFFIMDVLAGSQCASIGQIDTLQIQLSLVSYQNDRVGTFTSDPIKLEAK